MAVTKTDYPLLVGNLEVWTVLVDGKSTSYIRVFSTLEKALNWIKENGFITNDGGRRYYKYYPNAHPAHRFVYAKIKKQIVDDESIAWD